MAAVPGCLWQLLHPGRAPVLVGEDTGGERLRRGRYPAAGEPDPGAAGAVRAASPNRVLTPGE